MTHPLDNCNSSSAIIDRVETTSDTLTGRGGLSLFVRYVRGIGLMPHLNRLFGSIRRSTKGRPVPELFKQLFCFFLDGTSRHLVHFDALKQDPGYAAAIESRPEAMASSHAVKRFFQAFSWPRIWLFRRLLQHLFLWRLNIREPAIIVLGLDTMIMDNDEALKRHGVQPTYKGVKGFQPLQMTWGRYVVDAVFRGGKKHSNYGDTVQKAITHVVKKIRRHYSETVPIIVRMDSGFFDQKLFAAFEELGIGYQVGGKIYDDIREYISAVDKGSCGRYENKEQQWDFFEFGDCRGSWSKFRRALYCRPVCDGRQQLLEFARPETVIYTNLGMGYAVDEQLIKAGRADLLKPEGIIQCHHDRGSDELVHRGLKDFASEELPFKQFAPNAAYYYTTVVAFFLFEAFKEDVCQPVVAVSAYATTVRRKIIDIAAKIVRTAGKILLKVTTATWNQLHFHALWQRSGTPPQFAWACPRVSALRRA